VLVEMVQGAALTQPQVAVVVQARLVLMQQARKAVSAVLVRLQVLTERLQREQVVAVVLPMMVAVQYAV
jgi:hypothetical protein